MILKELLIGDEAGIAEMSAMATEILKDYYDGIIGAEQNDYMLRLFQTPEAVREQLSHGYRYYFAAEEGRNLGFFAFYPKETCLYLSKLYLYKTERGKGYANSILRFLSEEARRNGLHAIELNVNKYNPTVKIYEKLGFRRIRDEKNDIGSGYYMDDYVYSLRV